MKQIDLYELIEPTAAPAAPAASSSESKSSRSQAHASAAASAAAAAHPPSASGAAAPGAASQLGAALNLRDKTERIATELLKPYATYVLVHVQGMGETRGVEAFPFLIALLLCVAANEGQTVVVPFDFTF